MAKGIYDDDEPLWKRIFLNEFIWAIIAILVVLFVAFHFATEEEPGEDDEQRVEQQN